MDRAALQLWEDMKAYAADYASSDRPLPVDEECEMWVRGTLRRSGIDSLKPDALEFYVSELCEMIRKQRAAREQEKAEDSPNHPPRC
jgi:hypothetical protein